MYAILLVSRGKGDRLPLHSMNRTLPQVDKTRGIKKLGNPKKTLDKLLNLCYNKYNKGEGKLLPNQKGNDTMAKMNEMMITAKLVNLCSALSDCGIPAEIMFQTIDGEEKPILLAALWDCNSGNGIRLEVCEDVGPDAGEILAVANPMDYDYEELVALFEEEECDEEEED